MPDWVAETRAKAHINAARRRVRRRLCVAAPNVRHDITKKIKKIPKACGLLLLREHGTELGSLDVTLASL